MLRCPRTDRCKSAPWHLPYCRSLRLMFLTTVPSKSAPWHLTPTAPDGARKQLTPHHTPHTTHSQHVTHTPHFTFTPHIHTSHSHLSLTTSHSHHSHTHHTFTVRDTHFTLHIHRPHSHRSFTPIIHTYRSHLSFTPIVHTYYSQPNQHLTALGSGKPTGQAPDGRSRPRNVTALTPALHQHCTSTAPAPSMQATDNLL